jgi:hypothetical protein
MAELILNPNNANLIIKSTDDNYGALLLKAFARHPHTIIESVIDKMGNTIFYIYFEEV